MSRGRLVAIAIRAKPRAPMVELDSAEITLEQGVVGDFRGRRGPRQITVLSADHWEAACAELGRDLPWTTRRANLLIAGITLADTKGAALSVGDVVLEITCETDPCLRMDEQFMGLQNALEPEWRGGVCCRVVSSGSIRPGDQVILDTNALA